MLSKNEFLVALGIPSHIKGFKYLLDVIDMFQEGEKICGLYIDIAKNHNTTGSRVERSIRHAVESSYPYIPKNIQDFLFGNINIRNNKPVNGLYMSRIHQIYNSPNELKKFEILINNSEED